MTTAWKHRLVGGFTLLVAAVLIVPLVFTGQGRIPEARITDIPATPVLADRSAVADPIAEEDTRVRIDRIFSLADGDVVNETPPDDDVSAEQRTSASAAPEEPDAMEPLANMPVDTAGDAEAWSVQLGSFRDAENAQRLLNDVRAAGYAGYTRDSVLSDGSTLTQVMVGPGADLDAVRALETRLSREFSLSALVVRFRP